MIVGGLVFAAHNPLHTPRDGLDASQELAAVRTMENYSGQQTDLPAKADEAGGRESVKHDVSTLLAARFSKNKR